MEADTDGKADLDLPLGNFDLVVEGQGFCPQKRALNNLGQPQTIKAELKLDSCPGPCQAASITVLAPTSVGLTPAASMNHPVEHPGLKIIVEDQAGVRIPLARIDVRTEKNTRVMEIIANKWGEATISLDPEKYGLSVGAPGFNESSQAVDLTTHNDHPVKVMLSVANQCAGCLSVGPVEEIEFEHVIPEATIPIFPLRPLPLPARKLRFKGSHHQAA